jgi:sigma-B regulation protein RsbU (phosphoserine phosphatase)
VGFGGVLPDGEFFAVVLFSRTPISRETAEQFRTITGSVGLALLPYAGRVFDGDPPAGGPDGPALVEWRAAALDQLLQVREVAILEQSLRIEQALADIEDRAAELARSRSVLAESEARKAAILSASLDAIVTVGADGLIVEFNAAAERMFGYAAADAVGAPMASLIVPERLRAAHHAGFGRHLATGESRILGQRVEIEALRSDGTEFPVELAVTRIEVGGPPMFTAHIRDLTSARRTEADLRELADTLQAGLLPPRPPRIPGVDVATYYRAGGRGLRVGGDFYDVFRLGDDEWGVIIGDVCGKGAKAASVTALVRHTARAAAAHSPYPSDVMHEINAALADGPDADDRYCSAVFARLSVSPGRVEVQSCGGGHPTPLILRASGLVEPAGVAGGQLVGLFEEYEATCDEYVLAAGDVVVLYTDGVTEARDLAGDLFGQERLAGLLAMNAGASARDLVAAVTRALQDWTDEPGDDIAIVALQPLAP